jgi:hypothetical protein
MVLILSEARREPSAVEGRFDSAKSGTVQRSKVFIAPGERQGAVMAAHGEDREPRVRALIERRPR